jgi:excisionase family DNA binding protein
MSENTHEEPSPDPGGEELLTRTEVARRLRIHPSTVDSWREKYGLPAIEKGNKVYFDWADVKAWLKSKPQKARRRKKKKKKAARRGGGKRRSKAGGDGEVSGKELQEAKREGAAEERRVLA